jgi:hypothetical protein
LLPQEWKRIAVVGVVALLVLAFLARFALASGWPRPARPAVLPTPVPAIQTAELRYATRPAPGVWAELKVILDNPRPPMAEGPTQTILLVPDTFFDEFTIRSTEPAMIGPPRRRDDGRYALSFPAPLSQSLNWYRVELAVRRPAARALPVAFAIDRPPFESRIIRVAIHYADREADPFLVVPELLVAWLPGQARSTLPLLLVFALALGAVATAGCVAAYRAVRP